MNEFNEYQIVEMKVEENELEGYLFPHGQHKINVILLLTYMFVFPFVFLFFLDFVISMADIHITNERLTVIHNGFYYVIMFALVILVYKDLLSEGWKTFSSNFARCLKYIFCGLGLLWVSNFVVNILLFTLTGEMESSNNSAIESIVSNQIIITLLFTIAFGPLVEEVMFRGIIFKGLYHRSKTAAYIVSSVCFGLLHVWQTVIFEGKLSELLYVLPYACLGAVFAFVYDRTKNIWTGIFLHMIYNALAMLMMILLMYLKSMTEIFS